MTTDVANKTTLHFSSTHALNQVHDCSVDCVSCTVASNWFELIPTVRSMKII